MQDVPKTVLKGDPIVDYLLNEQGKFFPLRFYNRVVRGLALQSLPHGYENPSGIWKGVLLKNGFVPYTNKQQPWRLYIHQDCVSSVFSRALTRVEPFIITTV